MRRQPYGLDAAGDGDALWSAPQSHSAGGATALARKDDSDAIVDAVTGAVWSG